MRFNFSHIAFWQAAVISFFAVQALRGQDSRDLVNGNLIQFNDNGAWCWYQDERAVVDTLSGRVVIGSDASGSGVGGSLRNGNIEAVIFDLGTGLRKRFALKQIGCDDHDTPAFLVRPDGRYVAMYAGHNGPASWYRLYDINRDQWSVEKQFLWSDIPGGTDFNATYSNLFYLAAEGKAYNFVRCYARSPNIMISTDQGSTWSYGGLISQPDMNIGYVNGYFKYSSNEIDRIDFVGTEHHPRDYNTSIYHGYIKGGQSFKSDGTLLDSDISDKSAPKPADFTRVFAANTVVNGITMTRCWNIDLQLYQDGTLATLLKARSNDSETDHRFFYARYDGATWSWTYLCRAGSKLYSSEQDYVGLGALDPNDPRIIYLSTPFDPRDDTDLKVHEIFKGITPDHGVTWIWTPITRKSVRDNLRPIVPAWDKDNTALLWWRGTYNSAQNFDAAVVGILDRRLEKATLKSYVDASPANTTLSDGAPLVTTGPSSDQGPADNKWHQRTGFGNGGTVFTSAEVGSENAPTLITRLILPQPGNYDIWVNFWANPSADWRIEAGLSFDDMQLYRQMACKQVESSDYSSPIILTGNNNVFFYQAYLGRVQTSANDTVQIFVDDEAIQTGTNGTRIGDTARTWYDGISYARVDRDSLTGIAKKGELPIEFNLKQNYPNPFNPSTEMTFSLARNAFVKLEVFNILGEKVAALIEMEMSAGTHTVEWNAQDAPSGVYLYRISVGSNSLIKKMTLLK